MHQLNAHIMPVDNVFPDPMWCTVVQEGQISEKKTMTFFKTSYDDGLYLSGSVFIRIIWYIKKFILKYNMIKWKK